MRKTAFAALATGLLVAAAAMAQDAGNQPKPAGAGGLARVGVIDMQEVSSSSQLGKGYAVRLETLKSEIDQEGTKKQAELNKLDAAIKALEDELGKQGSVLSPEATERKQQEIVRKRRERQAYLEDGQQELQRMRERAQQQAAVINNEFQQRIRPHIEAVAKERGVDILLDSQVALTVNSAFDISKEVIARVDAAEKAAPKPGAGAAAPKPPASPAAPGASPAAPAPSPAAPPPAPSPAATPTPSPSPSPKS